MLVGSKDFPKEEDRLNHIFEHQVYGLAPTEIIYKIAVSYILAFENKVHVEKHNLRLFDTLPAVQKGTLEKDLDTVFANKPKDIVKIETTKNSQKQITEANKPVKKGLLGKFFSKK